MWLNLVTSRFGWMLGLVGIAVLATSLFQLQRDWFDVAKSQKPRLSKSARRLYVASALVGFGLFIFAMVIGPHR